MRPDGHRGRSSQALGTAEPHPELTFIAGVLFVVPHDAVAFCGLVWVLFFFFFGLFFLPLEEIHNETAVPHGFGDSKSCGFYLGAFTIQREVEAGSYDLQVCKKRIY